MSTETDLRAQIAALKADIDFGDIAFFAFLAWALYLMGGR